MKKKLIDDFIDIFFKNEDCVLLFGSSNVDKVTDLVSDVDLLIFSNLNHPLRKEIIEFNGFYFDTTTISKATVFEALEKDKYIGSYLDIISTGSIIIDKYNFIYDVRLRINNQLSVKDLYLKILYLEYCLNENYNLFLKSTCIYETELILNNLIEDVLKIRLLKARVPNSIKVKYLYKKISVIDKDLLIETFNIKKKFFSEKKDKTIKSINTLFKNIDVRLAKNYANSLVIKTVNCDELVVFSKLKSQKYEEAISYLKSKNYSHITFSIDKGNILNAGNYAVVFEKRELLNKFLIPKLRVQFQDNLLFPFQLNMFNMLGVVEIDRISFFKKIFIFLHEIKLSKTFKLEDILTFIIGIYLKLELHKVTVKKKLEELFICFATKSFQEEICLDEFNSFLLHKKIDFDGFLTDENKKILASSFSDVNENWKFDALPNSLIKEMLNKEIINELIFKSQWDEYRLFNMVFNIAEIKDFHKTCLVYYLKETIRI